MERELPRGLVPNKRELDVQKKMAQLREHAKDNAARDLAARLEKHNAEETQDRQFFLDKKTADKIPEAKKAFVRTAREMRDEGARTPGAEGAIDQSAYDLLNVDESVLANEDIEALSDAHHENLSKNRAETSAVNILNRGKQRVAAEKNRAKNSAEAIHARGKARMAKNRAQEIADFSPKVEDATAPHLELGGEKTVLGSEAFDWNMDEAEESPMVYNPEDRKELRAAAERHKEELHQLMAEADERRAAKESQSKKKIA